MSGLETVTDTASGAKDAAGNPLGSRNPTGDLTKSTTSGAPTTTGSGSGSEVAPKEDKPSSLKIHIQLDIDVEVHLTARVKGDITIGLL